VSLSSRNPQARLPTEEEISRASLRLEVAREELEGLADQLRHYARAARARRNDEALALEVPPVAEIGELWSALNEAKLTADATAELADTLVALLPTVEEIRSISAPKTA